MRKLIIGCVALVIGLLLASAARGQAGQTAATEVVTRPDWLEKIGQTSEAQVVRDPDGYPWLRLSVRGIPMVFAWPNGNPYFQDYVPLALGSLPAGPQAYVTSYPGYPGVYLITQFAFYTEVQGHAQRVYDRVGLVTTGGARDGVYALATLAVPADRRPR